MIAWLSGTIREKRPGSIVLQTGGVGYLVNISLSTFYSLPEEGEEAQLHIHTNVKEDSISLFGFATSLEMRVFNLLIGVNKIGPKLAISILSGLKSEELIEAVMAKDITRLSSAPGVGKKTAERMAMELGDKFSELAVLAASGDGAEAFKPTSTADTDAVDALLALGYKKPEAQKAVKTFKSQNSDAVLEDIIRGSLAILSG